MLFSFLSNLWQKKKADGDQNLLCQSVLVACMSEIQPNLYKRPAIAGCCNSITVSELKKKLCHNGIKWHIRHEKSASDLNLSHFNYYAVWASNLH